MRVVRVSLALLLCVGATVHPLRGQTADLDRPPLRLRPGDRVVVRVAEEPQLSGELTVDPSGMILVPLAGLVQVADRDFDEVAREIRERLGAELADRPVQVVPRFRMAILGEVRSPGLFPVDESYSFTDALAVAGGLTGDADREGIVVTRDGVTVVRVHADDVGELDILFRPGDRIFVERQGWVRRNLGVFVGTISSLTVAVVTGLLVR